MKHTLKLTTAVLLLACSSVAVQAEESFWQKQKKAATETSKEVAKGAKKLSGDVADKAKELSGDAADTAKEASGSLLDAYRKTKDEIKKKLD